ncbi:hypothetical protein l11_08590 [Neisseria weaveri LMG 5135]|nr:hypothetical protein l13_07850 [Neisseria weaveri ATCC 51223]EGV37907.1 hypothetical protein l11_08590 [Neisseria weaveri LMG 5135]
MFSGSLSSGCLNKMLRIIAYCFINGFWIFQTACHMEAV